LVWQKLVRVIDDEGQGGGALPYGDLPVRRRTVVQMIGDTLAPRPLYGEKDAHQA
jgi:hypothetical protein